jgi:Domain of unknown function (DUF4338)
MMVKSATPNLKPPKPRNGPNGQGPGRVSGPARSIREPPTDEKLMLEPELEKPPQLREVAPALPPEVQHRLFSRLLAEKDRLLDAGKLETFSTALRDLIDEWQDDPHSLMLRTTCLLVADLIDQGWEFAIGTDRVTLKPPGLTAGPGLSPQQIKERIRRSLQAGRTRQLQEPSVRHFIRRMERVVARDAGRSSIADLIDDGRELERLLLKARRLPCDEQERRLRRLIDPVVEVCENGSKCPITGLNRIDIWRYFRHTWSLEYRPIPGRQLPLLIRNAARPNRPVIGIALLASPVMRLKIRDNWIGWTPPAWARGIGKEGWDTSVAAAALLRRVDQAIAEIRWDDLASAEEIARPTQRVVFRLELVAAGAAERRTRQLQEFYAENRTSRHLEVRDASEDTDWRTASEDHLYVRKRAEVLGSLLAARLAFADAGLHENPRRAFRQLVAMETGWRALDTAIAEFRKLGLASQVVDVSVCGAVHPYNELLGGKLVALVLHSKEVRDIYEAQYGGRISLIASQMAGQPVRRSATLKVLTTTSLYGVGSSQYNRLKLRASEHPGLTHDLSWRLFDGDEEDLTSGYGTVHLGSATVDALRELSGVTHGANRVNNRFGEGSSPRLRQIREGLDALGLESNHILHHATPRLFCASELEPNARQQLLGLSEAGNTVPPPLAAISAGWRRRWLLNRIQNDEVLDRVGKLGPESVRATLWSDEDGQFVLPFD